jgi:hypothetical protein
MSEIAETRAKSDLDYLREAAREVAEMLGEEFIDPLELPNPDWQDSSAVAFDKATEAYHAQAQARTGVGYYAVGTDAVTVQEIIDTPIGAPIRHRATSSIAYYPSSSIADSRAVSSVYVARTEAERQQQAADRAEYHARMMAMCAPRVIDNG